LLILLLLLLCAAVRSAQGVIFDVRFIDLTEESLQASLGPNPLASCTNAPNEKCTVTLPDVLKNAVTDSYFAYFKIKDRENPRDRRGDLSDVVQFSVSREFPKDLKITFYSDPIPSSVTQLITYYDESFEEGPFFAPVRLPPNLPALQQNVTLTVAYRSDIDVPEPSTLVVAAVGVGCLVLARARRHRRLARL